MEFFLNQDSHLKLALLKQDTGKKKFKLESCYFLAQNAQIWGFDLKIFENQYRI